MLAIQPIMIAYKKSHPVCEKCKSNKATEVDHVSPEFKAIVAEALSVMSSDDWVETFANFDWWNDESFRFSKNNPALKYMLRAHDSAVLQSVCKACHLKNAVSRKGT